MKNFKKAMPLAVAAAMILSGCSHRTAPVVSDGGNNPANLFDGLQLAKSYKPQNNFNPIATQKFGADPYAMEYNGRVYVYMTNDVLEYDANGAVKENSFALVNKVFCVSSEDLVNWTDHGAMPIAREEGAAKWAQFAWAPSACHKTIDGKEKFFLYFANSGNGIGVVTSDTPYGPWVDPIKKPIIDRHTPTCNTVTWLFDPAVLVDDNGDGYLFVGGGVPFVDGKPQAENPGTARVVKLDASMTALDGNPAQICPPWLFEDAGANKIGDTYYYSYCTNFNNPDGAKNGAIAYMTSKNPMGPYEYQGIFFDNPYTFTGMGGNNHHAVCKLGNDYYLFYHTQILRKAMGVTASGYRCTSVDKVTVSADGKIEKVTGTYEGVAQLKDFDPYKLTEAETMAWEAGIETEYVSGSTNLVVKTKAGSWMGLSGVNFGNGAKKFTVKASSNGKPAAIKICLDKADGECVGYVSVNSAAMAEASAKLLKAVSGKHDLFFVFSGDMELDTWKFE
ncbi:MAG: glycoside hydrolase family 43 protein [Bacteroidales bacterium]|nr:glycoside hydrolase family 43 protein [Bacteroidales bacterium]